MNALLWAYGLYLLGINLMTAYLYYRDKRAGQQGKWRVAERTLFLANLLGGVIGAWLLFFGLRHKTRHLSFWVMQGISTLIHLYIGWQLFTLSPR